MQFIHKITGNLFRPNPSQIHLEPRTRQSTLSSVSKIFDSKNIKEWGGKLEECSFSASRINFKFHPVIFSSTRLRNENPENNVLVRSAEKPKIGTKGEILISEMTTSMENLWKGVIDTEASAVITLDPKDSGFFGTRFATKELKVNVKSDGFYGLVSAKKLEVIKGSEKSEDKKYVNMCNYEGERSLLSGQSLQSTALSVEAIRGIVSKALAGLQKGDALFILDRKGRIEEEMIAAAVEIKKALKSKSADDSIELRSMLKKLIKNGKEKSVHIDLIVESGKVEEKIREDLPEFDEFLLSKFSNLIQRGKEVEGQADMIAVALQVHEMVQGKSIHTENLVSRLSNLVEAGREVFGVRFLEKKEHFDLLQRYAHQLISEQDFTKQKNRTSYLSFV